MPEASTDAFLSGQGVSVELPEVESKLAELWGPAAEREGGPDVENPALTRVVLANLVVVNGPTDDAKIDQVLPVVEAHYPCRAIVLHRNDDAERKVRAEVSALCHLPVPGLPQVCSERIVLRAGPNAQDLLPGSVRPLLEADLPFVLWWADDPKATETLLRELADEASRILVQHPDPSGDPAALRLVLDPALNNYSRDLAWFGITRWRELAAQFFDPIGAQKALREIVSVRIDVVAASGERPPRVAAWLAAWLAGQLGWTDAERRDLGSGNLDATFTGPSGPIAVAIRTTVDSSSDLVRITQLCIETKGPGGGTYRVARSASRPDDVEVECAVSSRHSLPRTVAVDEFDAPRRVAAGLESAREDPPYRKALPHMFWLIGG